MLIQNFEEKKLKSRNFAKPASKENTNDPQEIQNILNKFQGDIAENTFPGKEN